MAVQSFQKLTNSFNIRKQSSRYSDLAANPSL